MTGAVMEDKGFDPFESTECCRSVIENVRDIIAVLDQQGTFVFVSPAFESVMGYRPVEVVGTNAFDLVHTEDLQRVTADFERSLSEPGQEVRAQYRSRTKDGDWRVMESLGTNLVEDPFVKGIIIISRDVTEREAARRRSDTQYLTFKAVIDSIDYPIFSVDPDYRYTSFNKTHAEVMKALYDGDIKIGGSLLEYSTVPEDRELAKQHIDRALAGERVVEEAYSGEEGLTRLYFEVLHNPIRGADGAIAGVSVSARDITERRRAETALQKSEEKYRTLFENMLEGFAMCRIVLDDAGRPVDWVYLETNKAFEALTGLKDMVGKRVTEAIPGIKATNPELFEFYGSVATTGAPRQFETYVPQLERHLAIKVFSPARGYFVAVFENISKRKQAEHKLQQTNLELEGFAHTVSHDLRGPLSAINLSVALLRNLLEDVKLPAGVDDDFRETLSLLERNVQRAVSLIENLLMLAEAGQVPVEVEMVDIDAVVKQVVEDKKELIQDKGVHLVTDDGLGRVLANPTHMYQLFSNLLSNAIKHNDNPQPVVTVSGGLTAEVGLHEFTVRDNGPGVPDADLERIFVPFFRGKSGETGIGLSIVERIVSRYGGSIKVHNDVGAVFTLTLRDATPERLQAMSNGGV